MSFLDRLCLSISSCPEILLEQVRCLLNLESAQYGMAWLCVCVCVCLVCVCACVGASCACVLACCVCACAWVLCVVLRAWIHIILEAKYGLTERSPLLNLKAVHIYQMALTVAAV